MNAPPKIIYDYTSDNPTRDSAKELEELVPGKIIRYVNNLVNFVYA
jgi:hypothetical protein